MGIALLIVIPVLALLGIFGPGTYTITETVPGLEMQVEYPSRFRYKTISSLEVSLKNTSDHSLPLLTVAFDHTYISRFSEVQFTPSPESVTGTDYRVRVDNILPGEVRRVSVSLQAERYGRHQGNVRTLVNNNSGIRLPVSTFVFP